VADVDQEILKDMKAQPFGKTTGTTGKATRKKKAT
jgi:hypothetical protein